MVLHHHHHHHHDQVKLRRCRLACSAACSLVCACKQRRSLVAIRKCRAHHCNKQHFRSIGCMSEDVQKKELPFKIWRRKLADEYFTHLVISTCVEIYTTQPKRDISDVYGFVIEIFHRRLDDLEFHPRDKNWSESHVVEKFSMFKSRTEWRAFFENPQNSGQNLAKRTPRDVGIDPLNVTWAKSIWARFGRIKSHVINIVNVDLKKLLTKNAQLKSGVQRESFFYCKCI